jgi:hypothetical protein
MLSESSLTLTDKAITGTCGSGIQPDTGAAIGMPTTGMSWREEGLNENGEAPPPYMPKDEEETGNAGPQVNGQRTHGENTPVPGEPAIPMQTLSRDHAGLKPPGYEQSVQPVGNEPSGSRLP